MVVKREGFGDENDMRGQRRLCMHVTQLHSLCGRGHQAFVTEAVPLGELLHEEARFGLKGLEYPEDTYSRLDFASKPYLE